MARTGGVPTMAKNEPTVVVNVHVPPTQGVGSMGVGPLLFLLITSPIWFPVWLPCWLAYHALSLLVRLAPVAIAGITALAVLVALGAILAGFKAAPMASIAPPDLKGSIQRDDTVIAPIPARAMASGKRSMSFEACNELVRQLTEGLDDFVADVANTRDTRAVKVRLSDGVAVVTCSRPDRTMVVQQRPAW